MQTNRLVPMLCLVTMLSACVSLAVLAAPAAASVTSARLEMYGPGKVYTAQGEVTLAVAAGKTASYSVKIVNTGTTLAQFKFEDGLCTGCTGSLPAKVETYSGSSAVTPLAGGTTGFYTNALAPGASQVLTVKVTPNAGDPQGAVDAGLVLYTTGGTQLDTKLLETEIEAPTFGTTPWDVYARNGSQPFIGGSVNGQVATAPSVKPNASTTFTVRLQNDGTSIDSIGLDISETQGCESSFPVTIKDGTADVTNAALSGTYLSPNLAVHAHHDLKVTVKYLSGDPGCTAGVYQVTSLVKPGGGQEHWSYLLILSAA